ncbi:replication initiator protein A [Streptococcus infantarius]|uniref:Replication initiator protein A domain protein n=1 Tax=Streptococcus infantarius subsp. infantarius ATCC BAA-102 TaxID=471872 RepID=A0ABM9XF78_9STRE|nr:replication initiator protein A domain protein [Streptococcus infantarius subsp. infantarius ATCC BAA-102]QQB28690.1 replication initiator protein A [Streptococcus infantarius]
MVFNAITVEQYETSEQYFKLPKLLFESPRYEDMRLDSKVSYSILKDRLSLSLRNNWVDEEGRIYLVYSNTSLMKILKVSKSTLLRIKKQLAEYDLIKEVQQSTSSKGNLANRIYLGNLIVDDFDANDDELPGVSNLDQGGVKIIRGWCQIQPLMRLNITRLIIVIILVLERLRKILMNFHSQLKLISHYHKINQLHSLNQSIILSCK